MKSPGGLEDVLPSTRLAIATQAPLAWHGFHHQKAGSFQDQSRISSSHGGMGRKNHWSNTRCSQQKWPKKATELGFYQPEIGIKANNECWLNRKMRDGFWLTNAMPESHPKNAWTSRSQTEELEPAAEVFFDQSFLRLVYWRCLKIGNPKVWWLSLSISFPFNGHWAIAMSYSMGYRGISKQKYGFVWK